MGRRGMLVAYQDCERDGGQLRFTTVTAITAVAVFTACTQTNSLPPGASSASCRPHARQTASSLPQNATPVPRIATVARLGLWPREGPSLRVCGDVGAGFARCQAWLRTDIQGLVAPNTPGGYAPDDLQLAYDLTADSKSNGGDRTVAIVDAYDDPNVESDLNVYRAKFAMAACTSGNGCFTEQKFTSQANAGWAGEISVDVDMVSAMCPNCKILLVEAASPSMADLSTAEQYATAHADYVSNSWSGDEGAKTYDNDYKVGCGAITAATGDLGHNLTAQWPAILPTVIGVGGTNLTSINPRIETAWSGAGSGCSKVYAKPTFQSMSTGCSMRAEADISADADPSTGVAIYDSYRQSGWVVFGGTSVAAPMVAAAFALAGTSSTDPVESLYSHTSSFNDVTSGSNGFCGAPLCTAGKGWDGPTGLGTPKGIGAF